ncbi:nucleotidyltransferase [Aliarcobacter butzleri]
MSTKNEIFKILEKVGESLEITKTQRQLAEDRYKAVGKWLAEGEYCLLGDGKKQCFKDGEIYPQGSFRLETTVKPIGKNEFDIDLVFYTPNVSADMITPERLKELVGNRLKEHDTYKKMLTPLNRGWCINYANEFHLDVTPSLDNHFEPHNESELVADKKLERYMPTNPEGYANWFDYIASMQPILKSTKELFESRNMMITTEDAATVTELPEHNPNKPLLKRFIQIFKRHRDIMFDGKEDAPISIIITTLATKSYEYCIQNYSYDNEYALMMNTLKYMTKFIENRNGYWIENPTVNGENFAEKWNYKPIKKQNFDNWHNKIIGIFESIINLQGQHLIFESLRNGLGESPVNKVYKDMTDNVTQNRLNGLLSLGLSSNATDSFAMKQNTFFGK